MAYTKTKVSYCTNSFSLETDREKKYAKYVKDEGYEAIKINKCGYPDRLTLLDDGYCFMIEFKRDVSKFTKRKGEKLQQHVHDELRARGIHVYLCDTVDQAKAIFRLELRKQIVLKRLEKARYEV